MPMISFNLHTAFSLFSPSGGLLISGPLGGGLIGHGGLIERELFNYP
jgi:hypothetical protein